MTIWQSIIMGIIEGFTEFLPISSTAHLILSGEILKIPASEFLKTYNISIQLGAILAVVVLYWRKIFSSKDLFLKILAAFIPTSIIGLVFYQIVKNYLMESLWLIAATLFLGGIILILFEKRYEKKNKILTEDAGIKEIKTEEAKQEIKKMINYKQAVLIGIFQTFAMIPGVSRSAATIIGGLWLGLKRKTIVEFSFLLAIPTMAAATFLDLIKSKEALMNLSSNDISAWIVGFILSFITAIIGVKFLLRFIQKNNFIAFGWYRIVLGILIAIILLFI
ncbi:undecaprenyl-diphosphatase UppP [Candidatus Falkowbacteria bacterium]|nr:undecaprenyl-diphosphatase UppP [Candidatus Falkowbacteria bacterium]NCT54349.1 undecaprenyl-diphosphatase UppP [Candidatus Falkowbacteria bacterium]